MDVRLPDGTVVTNVPEGITQADLMARVEQSRAPDRVSRKSLSDLVTGKERPEPTKAEEIAGSPVTRFALGAASPFLAAGQLLDQGMKKVLPESAYQLLRPELGRAQEGVAPLVKTGREARGSEGVDFANMAGSMAGPAGIAAFKAPLAATLAGKAGQGAAIGGLFGLGTPTEGTENFAAEKAGQVGMGATVGAVLPPAISGVASAGRAVRNVIDPWLPGGVERVVGRTANKAAGDKRSEVLQALLQNRQLAPGTVGAGEVAAPAGSAEFSALQRVVEPLKPTAYRDMAQGADQARVAAIKSVGQDKAALDAALGTRSANAQANYGQAYQQAVKADPQLAALSKNPYFNDAVPDALKLAEANGVNPKTDLTQFLHYVKLSLDKQVGRTGDTALSTTEKQAVQGVREKLIEWMSTKNPAYDAARAQFAADSKPINQMKVGQYLENKLVSPLTDEGSRPALFAQAVRDAPGTLKKATGFNRYDDIADVLTQQQTQTVKNVGQDLARKADYEDLSRRGADAARDIIGAGTPKVPASGMFNPKYSVARAIINRLTGKVEGKSLEALAQKMQDPEEMARLMQMSPPQRKAVIEALVQQLGRAGTMAAAQ
jgi:hypothetical protein